MQPILEYVRRVTGAALGSVVVVGAGDDVVLESLGGRAFDRLVLWEGGRERAETLAALCRDDARIQVRHRVLAPQAGVVSWYACTLPSFDGMWSPAPLTALFPRLRVADPVGVDAAGIAEALGELTLRRHEGRANVLVLDVPGQEAGLLAAIPPAQLVAFDFVVCRAFEPAGEQPAGAGLAWPAFCRPVALQGQDGPLWPVRAVRVDARAHEVAGLRAELARAKSRTDELLRDAGALRAAQAAATASEDALRGQLGERARRVEQLESQLAEAQRQCSAAEQSRADAVAAHDATQARLADRTRQVEQLESRLAALQRELGDHGLRIDELEAALRDRNAAAEAERRAAADREQALLRQLAEREQSLLASEKDRQSLVKRMAAQSEQVLAAEARADGVDAQLRRLQAEASAAARRQALLDEEVAKTEGQLELICRLMLRDREPDRS